MPSATGNKQSYGLHGYTEYSVSSSATHTTLYVSKALLRVTTSNVGLTQLAGTYEGSYQSTLSTSGKTMKYSKDVTMFNPFSWSWARTTYTYTANIFYTVWGKDGKKSSVVYYVTVPALDSYGIYYNGNGATGGATGAQTKWYGQNLTLNSNGFTRPGYSFWHWNTNNVNTGISYNAGGTYTANSGATLYAIWNPIIHYDANGGSDVPADQIKTFGTNIDLTDAIPVRDKYDFVEWNTAADGSGTSYHPGDTYTSNTALTLYAIWEKRATAKVKVDGAWHEGDIKCKVNGEWIDADSLYVKIGNEWVEI